MIKQTIHLQGDYPPKVFVPLRDNSAAEYQKEGDTYFLSKIVTINARVREKWETWIEMDVTE